MVLRGKVLLNSNTLKPVRVSRQLQDWQVRCVCGGDSTSCNNGWMRTHIEEKTAPILRKLVQGEELRLTERDQTILATWITLKSIISEYDAGGFVTTHHTQRKRLMNKNIPPTRGWGIWIGESLKRKDALLWHDTAFHISPKSLADLDTDALPTHYNGHSTTQIINKLFIQTVRIPEHSFIQRWQFNLPNRGSLFRIWPPTKVSIKWPGRSLTERDVDFASNAVEKALLRAVNRRPSKGTR